jgi:hypothetical protein
MLIYKNIIVGSGPTGCLVFKKLKKNSLIITGETSKKVKSNKIHPKIRLKLKDKTNKISDLIYSKKNNFSIYSSSEIGGFTNYWGKQFFDYKKNENWPKRIFKKFSSYRISLDTINKIYPPVKSKIISKTTNGNITINQLSPPIFKNKIVDKFKLSKLAKKKLISDRVYSFKKINKNLIKIFTENKIFYCNNLILCAGPIGNALIMHRSFKKIDYQTFKDDNPRMIFGLKFGKKKYLLKKNAKLMDFDVMKNDELLGYSTIYNIDPNHFNNIFKPIVRFFRPILQKIFFYGQFWVSKEYNEIKLTNKNNKISLTAKALGSNKKKNEAIKELDKIGFKVLKTLNLKFAYGFHYHCLKVCYNGKLFLLNDFINKMNLKNRVFCFDSSIIEKISLKPPTKTYLATTNFLVEKIFQKKL